LKIPHSLVLLPALALALACAGLAHAQSAVTLFGVVDVNLQHFHSDGTGSLTAVGNSGLSSSQLGFRGSEDLGGGLRVGFWLEAGLNPDNGSGRTLSTNNQPSGDTGGGGLTFDRRSYLSLGASWGELRLGRDYVPTHTNTIAFDPFTADGIARVGTLTFSGAANGSMSTTQRASNAVSYFLPRELGGFYGQVMLAFGENPDNVANGTDGRYRGARAGWAGGPFEIAGAYSHTDYLATASIGDYTQSNIGASWNAGFAKFFGLYNWVTVGLTAGKVRKDTWEIGATVPAGPQGRVRVSYVRLNDGSDASLLNADGSQRASNDASQWGLGYVYDFSKRTAAYGTYARVSNHGQGTYVVNGAPSTQPGGSSNGLELGLRHSF
jgi:predicted porin